MEGMSGKEILGPAPESCGCTESEWLRRALRLVAIELDRRCEEAAAEVTLAEAEHGEATGQLAIVRALGGYREWLVALGVVEFTEQHRYRCAYAKCPGYPYKASEMAHPAETCSPNPDDYSNEPKLVERLGAVVGQWVTRIAKRWDRHYTDSDVSYAELKLRLRNPGWEDDGTIVLEADIEETIQYDDISGRVEGVSQGKRKQRRTSDEVVFWRGSTSDVATDLAALLTKEQLLDLSADIAAKAARP